ncbi:MAG: S8 family serine peptidase [Candidatus Melainabacteria bacterium]|nr:S8 family serine peptidase [Candidatus Melainabacteria bacterium]MBI3307791.1 S8 family serine peptidase [Candidatus Melainabacteria bacterium]
MKNKLMSLTAIIFCLSLFIAIEANAQEISSPIPGQFIVKVKEGKSISDVAQRHGAQVLHKFDHVLNGGAIVIPPGKEKDIAGDLDVESLVQDFSITAFQSRAGKPPSMTMSGDSQPQILPTGINWIDAELNTTNEGSGATVAVLDTGIDTSHQDLMVNTSLSKNFTRGRTDKFNDDNGHGTAVGGIIAALDNTIDVVGVGSQIDLVAVKVLDSTGSGSFSWIIAGLDHVTANSSVIGVANLSLGAVGGTNPSQSFQDASALFREAVQRAVNAGVIVVVAAGNSSVDVTQYNVVPAMYPEVFSVSALDDNDGVQGNDSWAWFSNFGTEVDIIAPGVNITSTKKGGGITGPISGTSFSAPHVAGTVGLYIARNGRPGNADAQLIGSTVIPAISQTRLPLSSEPVDGVTEPSCFANGASLQ